jgi:hypothetical protein
LYLVLTCFTLPACHISCIHNISYMTACSVGRALCRPLIAF